MYQSLLNDTLTAPEFSRALGISSRKALADYSALSGDTRTRSGYVGESRITWEDISQTALVLLLGKDYPVATSLETRETVFILKGNAYTLRAIAYVFAKRAIRALGLRVDRLPSVLKFEGVSIDAEAETFSAIPARVSPDYAEGAEVLAVLSETYERAMAEGQNPKTAGARARREAVAVYRRTYAGASVKVAEGVIREWLREGSAVRS
jgi:hypothetical protein